MTDFGAVAIEVRNLSKVYRLWSKPAARLWVPLLFRLERICRWLPPLARQLRRAIDQRLRYHHALDDINFTLHRGEALGIIGLNGSGKSTLLQLIAGVLQPSSGSVVVNGRIAALLELGSGFNQEMTGRENVVVNAAVLGMNRAQIGERMDAIIAFADIGEYIDQPVKTYSSGMVMRLAFAVQVHVDPDILIVDEALSVGDAAFQAKAMTRIDKILKRGTTLLFVGHDLNAVKAFSDYAILLEKGRVAMRGTPEDVATEYLFRIQTEQRKTDEAHAGLTVERVDHGYGNADTCVVAASINDSKHVSLRYGEPIHLSMTVRVPSGVEVPKLIVSVLDARGLQVTGRRIPLNTPPAGGAVTVNVDFDATLQQGVYRLGMRVIDAPGFNRITVLSRQEGWLSFDVVDDSRDVFTGLFALPMHIEQSKAGA